LVSKNPNNNKGEKMREYLGVKLVEAEPMTLGEYNLGRGWDIPADEDPSTEGYFIVYPDGYKSWSPKAQFDEANREIDSMTFGHAIEAAKRGHKIARAGWNGKNMFVVYMPPLSLPPFNTQAAGPRVNDRTAKHIGKDTPLNSQPYFAMFNAQQEWIPGWVASQSDMLSDDWQIV
jgi:hypothetical protein